MSMWHQEEDIRAQRVTAKSASRTARTYWQERLAPRCLVTALPLLPLKSGTAENDVNVASGGGHSRATSDCQECEQNSEDILAGAPGPAVPRHSTPASPSKVRDCGERCQCGIRRRTWHPE